MKRRWMAACAALALMMGILGGCGSAQADSGNAAQDTEQSAGEEADLLDKIQEAGVLVVGTEGTYSPNSYHDENGDLAGFDVDVARGVAEHLGVDIQFVEAEWDSLFAGMDSGRVDIVVNEVERAGGEVRLLRALHLRPRRAADGGGQHGHHRL